MAVDVGFQLETDLKSLARSIDKVTADWEKETGILSTFIKIQPLDGYYWADSDSSLTLNIGGQSYLMGYRTTEQ